MRSLKKVLVLHLDAGYLSVLSLETFVDCTHTVAVLMDVILQEK